MSINGQNTLAVADRSNLSKTISTTQLYPIDDDQILVGGYDSVLSYPFVDHFSLLNGTLLSLTRVQGRCYFLFLTINNKLYCSTNNQQIVTRRPWKNQSNSSTVVAGNGSITGVAVDCPVGSRCIVACNNGSSGSAANQLNHPWTPALTLKEISS